LGCIAKHATRSMNDLGRRMNCVGQTKHKQIVTKRAAIWGVRTGPGLLLEIHSILLLFVPLKLSQILQ
jgi:hypothetical protein